ncbi:MAG: 3-hydroxy-9,10-secoandrosta-1,3,5(10)-triene-9,17-dione monooxygenase, partial [Alphaproteobacteria bacterium]
MQDATIEPLQNSGEQLTPADMIARARTLVPVLRERAEQAQRLGRVPPETMADYHRLGLLRMAQPRRYGGNEMGWDVLCEISQILAAADCSQAWIQRIMADHAQMVATFPEEAQDEVWHDNPQAIICAAFDPVGRATRVSGGFRFSGKHGFSSGVDYADWLICGGYIVEGEERDGPHFFLVERSNATILDDWNTMGLEGTGSKSFVVEDAFVPEYRLLDGAKARVGQGPGTLINTAPVYRTPRGGVTSTGFAALTVGAAQGVLQEWLLYTAPRKSRGNAVADDPGTHMIAARSSAEIDAAEALYFGTVSRAMRTLEAGDTLTDFDLTTARRNVSFAAKLALKAGTRIFNAAGGRALSKGNPLERQYRNL